jgi:hypothetical protein
MKLREVTFLVLFAAMFCCAFWLGTRAIAKPAAVTHEGVEPWEITLDKKDPHMRLGNFKAGHWTLVLPDLPPGAEWKITLAPPDGTADTFKVNASFTEGGY